MLAGLRSGTEGTRGRAESNASIAYLYNGSKSLEKSVSPSSIYRHGKELDSE